MTLDQLIGVLVTVAIVEMMATIGLSVRMADLTAVARDIPLIARAAAANYVLVPAVAILLLLLFRAPPMAAAGFLILACCPGAPYAPPLTKLAGGDSCQSIGLMALLAGSSALIAPFLLQWQLSLLSIDVPADVDAVSMAVTLLLTQLLPLAAGVALRSYRPQAAEALLPLATIASKLLNFLAIGLILTMQFPLLAEIRPVGFLGMGLLLAASGGIGWLMGGRRTEGRKALAVTTALRNIGVGLVIASTTFAGTPAVTAVAAYGVVSLFGTAAFSALLGRMSRRADGKS